MGVIPLSQTIFAPPILVAGLVILVTMPLLNMPRMPKGSDEVVEPDLAAEGEDAVPAPPPNAPPRDAPPAQRLNDSRVATLNEGIRTVSGIILPYPFYAGLMTVMSGLVDTISRLFTGAATATTLSTFGILSSCVINFVAPSAGGHWVIQGPFMIQAAKGLGAPLNQVAMAVMLGNAWNDLVQPFWLLPAMALAKIELKDIMGYLVIEMLWLGVVHVATLLIWAHA